MWTRVMEMGESALVRQALVMQQAGMRRVVNRQRRQVVRGLQVDRLNIKVWKAMSWLWWLYMILSEYEVGKKLWSVWLDNNNMHICPIRTIQQEGRDQ